MEEFRLDFDGINRAIKVRALTMAPTLFFAILLGFYIPSVRSVNAIEAFPTIVAVIVAIVFTLLIAYYGSQGFRRSLDSYTLTFDGNLITREQHNTPIITFTKGDIREISRDKKGSYRIKAESWSSPINIPAEVENADRLYNLLNNIVPVIDKPSHDSVFKKIGFILAIVAIILAFVFFKQSKNRIGVLTIEIILAGVTIYSLIRNHQDKNAEYSTKGALWYQAFLLIMLIISIYKNLTS